MTKLNRIILIIYTSLGFSLIVCFKLKETINVSVDRRFYSDNVLGRFLY